MCGDDEDPVAYGRVDNDTNYTLSNVTFAGAGLGDVNPYQLSSYKEIPLKSGKFTFDITYYTCETITFDAPEEDHHYTLNITGGGSSCDDFTYYAPSEDDKSSSTALTFTEKE
ncbi:MAG: hypothetical protein JW864_01075 [Spirochaetes bacterium]|nr:hypothetical protein [Spirochaetota bacterium]